MNLIIFYFNQNQARYDYFLPWIWQLVNFLDPNPPYTHLYLCLHFNHFHQFNSNSNLNLNLMIIIINHSFMINFKIVHLFNYLIFIHFFIIIGFFSIFGLPLWRFVIFLEIINGGVIGLMLLGFRTLHVRLYRCSLLKNACWNIHLFYWLGIQVFCRLLMILVCKNHNKPDNYLY